MAMASSPSDDGIYGSEKDENVYDPVSSPMSDTSGGAATGFESPEGETPEERERRLTELKEELEKVESEINMLRQVLGSKVRHASELKRKLGITPFQEFKTDLKQGMDQLKSSDTYQKTNEQLISLNEKISSTQAYQKSAAVMKTATEKTSSAFSSVGQVIGKKMGDLKNSNAFKSMDEKVHTTYASVKAKVTGSRSSSEIDEAFRDAQINEDGSVTTPGEGGDQVLPEEKVPL